MPASRWRAPQGGWLGVEVADRTFRITFYNEKKKPVAADATSAILRWPVHYQPNDERTELLPTDDPAVLASPYAVKGPLIVQAAHHAARDREQAGLRRSPTSSIFSG